MSTPQEYWDACLIKTWRNLGSMSDARGMFFSILGKWPEDVDPPMLRCPRTYVHHATQVQYFMSTFLPKMHKWLWDHGPGRDVDLLRLVTKSRYDLSKKPNLSQDDIERAQLSKKMRVDKLQSNLTIQNYGYRNQPTDWNVVKGPTKTRRRR